MVVVQKCAHKSVAFECIILFIYFFNQTDCRWLLVLMIRVFFFFVFLNHSLHFKRGLIFTFEVFTSLQLHFIEQPVVKCLVCFYWIMWCVWYNFFLNVIHKNGVLMNFNLIQLTPDFFFCTRILFPLSVYSIQIFFKK